VFDKFIQKKYGNSMGEGGKSNLISRRDFLKWGAAVAAGGGAAWLLRGRGPAGKIEPISQPDIPTLIKMPDHVPLPIVEQTIDEPVTIPPDNWDINFAFKDEGVSTVEDGYRKIKNTQLFNNNLEGVIIDSPERNLVIIYTNGLAFDRRGNINGLPLPWAEDRCVMGSPDKIKTLIDVQHLDHNKHVIMVEAQTYAVPDGANWELAAFGPGIQPQRYLQTMNDPVMRPVTP
jgi:hypothetical protein